MFNREILKIQIVFLNIWKKDTKRRIIFEILIFIIPARRNDFAFFYPRCNYWIPNVSFDTLILHISEKRIVGS